MKYRKFYSYILILQFNLPTHFVQYLRIHSSELERPIHIPRLHFLTITQLNKVKIQYRNFSLNLVFLKDIMTDKVILHENKNCLKNLVYHAP